MEFYKMKSDTILPSALLVTLLVLMIYLFSGIGKKLSDIEEKVENVEVHLHVLEEKMDVHFEELDLNMEVQDLKLFEIKKELKEVRRSLSFSPAKKTLVCQDGIFLTEKQAEVANKVANFAKDHDLVWSMTAIAWQESSFGKNLEHATSGAAGVMQLYPTTAVNIARQLGYKFESTEQLMKELKYDLDLNLEFSLHVLKYFIRLHSRNGYTNWNNVWASYYAGHNVSIGHKYYAPMVREKVRTLRSKCEVL